MGNRQKSTRSGSKAGYWASVLEVLCFLWCFVWDFDLVLVDGDADVAGDGDGVGFCAWAARVPNANTAASMRIALFISILVLSNSSGFRFDPVRSDPQRSTLELKPHSLNPRNGPKFQNSGNFLTKDF
jgi:hypothetical protein